MCCINVQFKRDFLRGATQKEKAERVGLCKREENYSRRRAASTTIFTAWLSVCFIVSAFGISC
ncbi:hypothetical protein S616_08470 [Salmonella enterica subsp. enterica]|nr:hypothetical protein [Salmonella enterica subsp. enterica serovar Adelaide]ECH8834282.1 hypothetical protein [Salmonella enterica subsp. enterica]